jgi:hypothetical protein
MVDTARTLHGYITHRNEDGTWWLCSMRGGDILSFTQVKAEALSVSHDTALRIMCDMEKRAFYGVRWTAHVV